MNELPSVGWLYKARCAPAPLRPTKAASASQGTGSGHCRFLYSNLILYIMCLISIKHLYQWLWSLEED